MKLPKSILLLLIAASLFSLTGCNAPATATPTAEPTLDVAAIKQEIYQTVVAQLTADAPKATPTAAATSTPIDTATAAAPVAPTITLPAIITVAPKSTFTAASSYTRYPTWTVTPYTDRASLSFQNPADGLVMAPGQAFDVKWVIKNIGARDWNNEFYIRYISGVKSSTFEVLMLPKVNRGGETEILADFVAPQKPGNYVSKWGLVNDDGVTFFHFNYVFSVK
ncbi:NBR1-Ig-like domain-containing protein [Leptolinea tardivitalis]|uniref:Nbr1 FW domain-containing protein n=1 Tax=Leptolinea tardivitalis TaxID=229920 RepID=A0A0P6X4C3_9CHLR|nr:NBR1-Ig-like domain-containing protein [Leptolinea tardivitalis]KPL74737.1 hypothetical protein ADM99_01265 [Leptolinea tardivitalis]GAP22895.1 hypothetical protein LTAR_03137 [Leptolinea tardivitalis]